jgi:hypothetical protein
MKLAIVALLACVALVAATARDFSEIDNISEEFDQDWDDWKTTHGKGHRQKIYRKSIRFSTFRLSRQGDLPHFLRFYQNLDTFSSQTRNFLLSNLFK